MPIISYEGYDSKYVYLMIIVSLATLLINSAVTISSFGILTLISYLLLVVLVDSVLMIFLLHRDMAQILESGVEWGKTRYLYYIAAVPIVPWFVTLVYTISRSSKISSNSNINKSEESSVEIESEDSDISELQEAYTQGDIDEFEYEERLEDTLEMGETARGAESQSDRDDQ